MTSFGTRKEPIRAFRRARKSTRSMTLEQPENGGTATAEKVTAARSCSASPPWSIFNIPDLFFFFLWKLSVYSKSVVRWFSSCIEKVASCARGPRLARTPRAGLNRVSRCRAPVQVAQSNERLFFTFVKKCCPPCPSPPRSRSAV